MPVDPTATASLALRSTDGGIADRLKSAAANGDEEGLREAAEQFEGYFVSLMLKEMREAGGDEGLFGGTEMDTFGGMFDQEIAGRVASKGLGLADMIVRSAQASAAYGVEPMPVGDGWTWPLPSGEMGTVSSDFGHRADPLSGADTEHHGVDLAAPAGTAVLAARGGTVTHAGPKGGYGNLVEVEHAGGLVTRYAHQDAVHVSPGDAVRAGDSLGTVGSTGKSTGPHLHFEVRQDGVALNPRAVLGR